MTPEQFQSYVTGWINAIGSVLLLLIAVAFGVYAAFKSKINETRIDAHEKRIDNTVNGQEALKTEVRQIALATPSPAQQQPSAVAYATSGTDAPADSGIHDLDATGGPAE